MTTSSNKPQPWEIWLAYVRFADHPEIGKVRPVVIIDNEIAAIVAAKVTTANPQPQYSYYQLSDWQLEGLLKPSYVQTAPLFRVSLEDVLNDQPLGILSDRDKLALDAALQDHDA